MIAKSGLLVLILLSVVACQTANTNTKAVPAPGYSQAQASSTLGTPIPLPFENRFPNRWNDSNNGTPFEPCVAYTDRELKRFDVDPSVVEDVAQVDGQGTRGCRWFMRDEFDLGQVVTNASSLSEYRTASPELRWLPDLVVDGRIVGSFVIDDGTDSTCSTYVQSFGAGVVTNVVASSSQKGRAMNACALVEDFTRAYIEKIPG
ncbi:uncharacterized protein DUF3558 [Williamsia limnetica]|uniref:Uncharacterized protein DUF3558 n=1 Tax=Williamsia limnetica TaxID=882452 RepID=A0A318RIN1_WILLI|nr:DUF3558 family protein [Williamsia limnetica]PYE14692.1 uncharacterized protein DUF3558 [Williamsia limnetica]